MADTFSAPNSHANAYTTANSSSMTESLVSQAVQTVGIIVAAFFSYRAARIASEARAATAEIKGDVAEVKKQTNHIKDELVAATNRAGLAEGHAAGLVQAHAEIQAQQTEATIFPQP